MCRIAYSIALAKLRAMSLRTLLQQRFLYHACRFGSECTTDPPRAQIDTVSRRRDIEALVHGLSRSHVWALSRSMTLRNAWSTCPRLPLFEANLQKLQCLAFERLAERFFHLAHGHVLKTTTATQKVIAKELRRRTALGCHQLSCRPPNARRVVARHNAQPWAVYDLQDDFEELKYGMSNLFFNRFGQSPTFFIYPRVSDVSEKEMIDLSLMETRVTSSMSTFREIGIWQPVDRMSCKTACECKENRVNTGRDCHQSCRSV